MASFEIVELDAKGNPRPFPAGVFPDGKSAAAIVGELREKYPNKKFQPRPLKDTTSDWRAREERRFTDEVYQPLGLDLTPIDGHYAHKAFKTPANIGYTASPEDGRIDKQTSIHIRVYLTRFYPQLSIEQKRKLVWDYCGEEFGDKLKIATTAEEIVHVYTNGPGSCMSDDADQYDTNGHHPAEAYAGPDLGVAYLEDGPRITARCIVWPEKKLYSGIYGDSVKLTRVLEEAGYRRYSTGSDWYGARLTAIKIERSIYVCPYLDICGYAKLSDDKQYLILCDSYKGEDARNTSGRIYL
jgi:hypothetical protein